MKISIITATYNSGSTLRDTIESVLNQTHKDIEYIIVDGVSKDNTLDIAREYEPRFEGKMRIVSEPDKGLYDAMNKGIVMATGDVVGILNSDDIFNNEFTIEYVISAFKKSPSVDCVYADLFYVSQNDTSKIVRHWVSGAQRSFAKGWHPAHPTFYAKNSVYQKFGHFNLSYKIAADFELMLRLIDKHKVSLFYIPIPLVRMRLGGESNKSIQNIKIGNLECIRAFHENDINVSKLYPLYRLIPKLKQFFSKK